MKTRRRIEILTTTEKIQVVRRTGSSLHFWCANCQASVRMLRPEEIALNAGQSARLIFRAIENQAVHFIETSDGKLFVCENSLSYLTEIQSMQQ